jgi:hypothetical protein
VFLYVYKSQGFEDRRKIMLSLFTISLLQLGITAPSWYAVRNCRWAELLRDAGHDDHAYHADVFNSFIKDHVDLINPPADSLALPLATGDLLCLLEMQGRLAVPASTVGHTACAASISEATKREYATVTGA